MVEVLLSDRDCVSLSDPDMFFSLLWERSRVCQRRAVEVILFSPPVSFRFLLPQKSLASPNLETPIIQKNLFVETYYFFFFVLLFNKILSTPKTTTL